MGQSLGGILKGLFSGSVLVNSQVLRRMPILAFLGFIMLVYMAIGFSAQRSQSELDELNDRLTELRTISITTSAMKQQLTRIENIEALLEEHNIELEISQTPPKVISYR